MIYWVNIYCIRLVVYFFSISLQSEFREFSSVGLEHLPYKQRVGGSNPSTPTLIKAQSQDGAFFVSGRFEFTQKRTEMKKDRLNAVKECFYPLHVVTTGVKIPQLPL